MCRSTMGDKSFLRDIVRFLKGGVIEDGKRKSTPQGGDSYYAEFNSKYLVFIYSA